MGFPKTYQFFIILMFFCLQLQGAAVSVYNVTPSFKKSLIVERLENIEKSVDMRFNKEVKKHIDGYLRRGKKGTELILGRSALYFPVFEYYLDLYNLPDDLKYLTVIESALKPGAVSNKGAGGLWQFMKATGRKYDLKINNYVDERYDLHKSSEAAVRFLSDLYDRYGDWSLAIAAYNSGTVNINRAIKKTGKKDFWAIRKHLPKETQDYVPKFIAASYAMNYYHFYNIRPEYPDYNLQLTFVTKIYDRYTFKQLASDSGISIEVIKQLNPSYKKQVIPPSLEGYNLVLPRLGLASNFEYELLGSSQ